MFTLPPCYRFYWYLEKEDLSVFHVHAQAAGLGSGHTTLSSVGGPQVYQQFTDMRNPKRVEPDFLNVLIGPKVNFTQWSTLQNSLI